MSEPRQQPNPDYVTPPDGTVVGTQVDFLTGKRIVFVMRNGKAIPEGECPGGGEEDEEDEE